MKNLAGKKVKISVNGEIWIVEITGERGGKEKSFIGKRIKGTNKGGIVFFNEGQIIEFFNEEEKINKRPHGLSLLLEAIKAA